MSRRVASKAVLNLIAQAATITTESIDIKQMDVAGFAFKWANGAANVFAFTLEVSFDGVDWFVLDLGGAVPIIGASGSHTVQIDENFFKYMRGVFTRTAGAMDLLCWYGASDKGA